MKTQIVLIVEDDADDEVLTTKGLRQSGLPIQVALWRDGSAAIKRLLDPHQPVPHLVVLDYRMPVQNGLCVLNAIRAAPHTRYVPVVVISNALSDSQARECLALGASCCMIKPLDPDKYVADIALMARFWLAVSLSPGVSAIGKERLQQPEGAPAPMGRIACLLPEPDPAHPATIPVPNGQAT